MESQLLKQSTKFKQGDNDCKDHDEDCVGVECKVTCWLYDPARGMCPYLRGNDDFCSTRS